MGRLPGHLLDACWEPWHGGSGGRQLRRAPATAFACQACRDPGCSAEASAGARCSFVPGQYEPELLAAVLRRRRRELGSRAFMGAACLQRPVPTALLAVGGSSSSPPGRRGRAWFTAFGEKQCCQCPKDKKFFDMDVGSGIEAYCERYKAGAFQNALTIGRGTCEALKEPSGPVPESEVVAPNFEGTDCTIKAMKGKCCRCHKVAAVNESTGKVLKESKAIFPPKCLQPHGALPKDCKVFEDCPKYQDAEDMNDKLSCADAAQAGDKVYGTGKGAGCPNAYEMLDRPTHWKDPNALSPDTLLGVGVS